MANSKIAARLARKWRGSPQVQVRAIIRTVADVDEVAALLEQRRLKVVYRYRLLPALTVTGAAEDVLALADEEWISKIEEDQQVHTMPPS